jgi:hypothetical protein
MRIVNAVVSRYRRISESTWDSRARYVGRGDRLSDRP